MTFNDEYQRVLDISGDDSSANTTLAKALINEAHKYVCGWRNWWFLEETNTQTSTASQTEITIPVNNNKIFTWYLTVSGVKYTPTEIADPVRFNILNSQGSSVTSDYPTHFHIRGNKILIYPAISSAGNTISIISAIRPVDMVNADYTTGTISDVTNGATGITGSGTSWATSTNAKAGAYIKINATGTDAGDEQWYKIASITNNTTLVLDINYEGTSIASGSANYTVGERPLIPEAYHDMLWYRAMAHFYAQKAEEKRTRFWKDMFNEILVYMQRNESTQTSQTAWEHDTLTGIRNANFFPRDLT